MRKARIIAGLVAASLFGGPAADAVALHNGDDNRVKQGFERLLNCQPAPAIADLTGPFIEAMKQGTPDGRARAARYLTLIGHGFGIDGNIPSYLACANMARSLDSENPTIIAFQMQALLRASRRDEVRDLVRQYEKTGERNSYLARTIGDYYRLLGDADTADAWLKKAMALNPSDPNPYAIYGRNSATDPKEQCAYLRQAADRTEPGSYRKEMYLWSADRMLMQGAAKTEHLEKAAALLPNEPGWRMSKAFFVLIKNDVNNAFNDFLAAAQSPDRLSLRALAQLATFSAYNNRPKLALKAANRVVELAPTLPESYLCRGHVQRQLGNTETAKKDYKTSIELSPAYCVGYEALWEYAENRTDDFLANWIKMCPEKSTPWLAAAERLRAQQKWADALSYYDKSADRLAKARKPVPLRITAGHGVCAYKLGQFDTAQNQARIFHDGKPANNDLIRVRLGKLDYSKIEKGSKQELASEHALLADMLYEGGELDDCIAEYKKAISLWDDPEWHRGLLKAYMDKRDFKSAFSEDLTVANNTVTKDIPTAVDKLRKQFGVK